MVEMKLQDRLLLFRREPVVTRNPAVVLEGFAIAALPVGKRRRVDADPAQEAGLGDFGLLAPFSHVIDDCIAYFRGNPGAF